ncbi:NUDIX domain-containing protein [Periweissella cryptocerci]|uniref:NUDIX domain-containing protein n=1 Tax=Periweissella cryptocerci TaxID=2506420 RepID=A0A4P6YS50_9LACO|nr:NUDIX domain-containing protein [Periweissella cryptocerci]QBO35508.1 NUDIX domain-containing protein [Periweissella cryptocerci]
MAEYIHELRAKVGNMPVILPVAGGALRDQEGRILLQRREEGFKWGFPGGNMEYGESAENTAIREYQEETGLNVRIKHLIGVFTDYYVTYENGDQAQTPAFFFEMEYISGELKPSSHETVDLAWFSPDDLPEIYNQQHAQMLQSVLNNEYGTYL